MLDAITAYHCPSTFIAAAWKLYTTKYQNNPSINGRVFECLILETLVREGITPFYYQARFLHVPNCDFDIVLYHPESPVVLSAKTSLRERYKQAALEGLALRQVYRRSMQYLITLSVEEAAANKARIASGDIVGLTDIIVASTPDYDAMLEQIGAQTFEYAQKILPLSGRAFPQARGLPEAGR